MITHTFHQSLIRPNLILGCDRDLFFMFALAAFILVVISQNWTAFFVGLFIWFSSLALLQRMARAAYAARLPAPPPVSCVLSASLNALQGEYP